MHFSTVLLAALAATPIVSSLPLQYQNKTDQFQAFAEEKKYGSYELPKPVQGTGSVRPFPHPSGKPFPSGTGSKPTFKPFPTGGFPKPSGVSGHPKPTAIASDLGPSEEAPLTFTKYATVVGGSSGESGEEVATVEVEETPKTSLGKPSYVKPSGKPYFPAPSGKPFPTSKPLPSGGKPTFKPFPTASGKPIFHPFPTASGKPKPTPTPLESDDSEPTVSTATVIPLPVATSIDIDGEYKIKAREEDDEEAEPVDGESPPIVATSESKKQKPTPSAKSGHAKPTGKPEFTKKPVSGVAHPSGGYAHPSGRPHHGHGGPSGFITSKIQKTLTATKTGGKGKPTLTPADE